MDLYGHPGSVFFRLCVDDPCALAAAFELSQFEIHNVLVRLKAVDNTDDVWQDGSLANKVNLAAGTAYGNEEPPSLEEVRAKLPSAIASVYALLSPEEMKLAEQES